MSSRGVSTVSDAGSSVRFHRHRRWPTLLLTVALTSSLAVGMTPQAAGAAPPALSTGVVQEGLSIPWDLAFLPNGQMLVTERPGRVRVYASGSPGAALVRTVTIPSVRAEGESGLLGIAVDIDFATNPYVYVCASREYAGSGGWRNQLVRYQLLGDGSWGGETVLVGGMLANRIHNGCAVEMDRSRKLWVGMGDASNTSLAQDRNSLNGKILRLNADGSVPSDNPVIGGTRNIVYSMGHRNPQGIALRPGTDQVFAIEHGPDVNDEINRIEAGGNYGWPCQTGAASGPCGSSPTTIGSIWASGGSTIATSGAAFVGGTQWADHNGNLFVSTLKESDIRRFSISDDGATVSGNQILFDGAWGRMRASVLGPGGQLYVTTSNGSNDKVIRIRPAATSVSRVAGADRFATAAALSQGAYPSGATDVVMATGTDFPDALAGSAVAGMRGMPILLTEANALPGATQAELDRLNPQRIWVLGGTSVVSESVRAAVAAYASSGEATRVAGSDRFDTAAAISNRWYAPGVQAAFVAVGTDFADALAGAPAAALRDSPLLLVQGDGIPAATVAELQRLQPQRIYVLGGTATIGSAVESQLDAYTSGPVLRLAGANRFATAEAISRTFWVKAPAAYVASGVNFPDALAGSAVAGNRGLPMLLSAPDDVSMHTGQDLLRLSPAQAVMLGGTGALTATVEARLRALVAAP
ncbi:glucose/arabinose dehydrogenase/putative cell wall-binding protein [Agromyces sp. 3263]|uniref:PQQ-dependent sugar dehydrogenase n=1 Tax=Agromyces sp. 3263 TaxID=2817750 RepID=UPI0028668388|nr:PQQ-dependent sugar dehydrogenase [Agromyces sp. 3263]MDR6905052.1 glucose/arabinose dehydrogenase/putative cell wall-binding protein [Agromyces sp. 3263]